MPRPSSPRQSRPEAWFAGVQGRAVLASEWPDLVLAPAERPGIAVLCVSAMPRPKGWTQATQGHGVWLHAHGSGYGGDLRCGQEWPLVNESVGTVVLQHAADCGADWDSQLSEAERVLVPGGRVWLFALNPLSPYRRLWWREGLQAVEPFTWRRRLRAHGLEPDAVAEGIGPGWAARPAPGLQVGAGARAAYRLRGEKRRIPLTPARARRAPVVPVLDRA